MVRRRLAATTSAPPVSPRIWGFGSNGTENRLKGLKAIRHRVHLPSSEAAISLVLLNPGVQMRSGQGS